MTVTVYAYKGRVDHLLNHSIVHSRPAVIIEHRSGTCGGYHRMELGW